MKNIIEKRNQFATKQQVTETYVVIKDFLQNENIVVGDVHKFLKSKKFTIAQLEKIKNEFIDFAIYGKETEFVKEFLEEQKQK